MKFIRRSCLACKLSLYFLFEPRILLKVVVIVWQRVEDDVGTHERSRCLSITFMLRAAFRPARRSFHTSRILLGENNNYTSMHSFPLESKPPFTEQTSPNPTLTKYAQATESLHTYGSYLTQCLPKFIQQFSVLKDELTLYTSPSGILPVLTFLRDHSQCQFKSLMDISGVDFPEREKRFEVVYHLLSLRYRGRIRVKTYAGEGDHVPSAVELFRGADWYEREAWDLFGIYFSDHPDLRRILTDYGFEGHPMRKDFPLTVSRCKLFPYSDTL